LGSLKVGALGDASVFEVIDEPTPYTDVTGEVITGEKRFAARGLVLDGAWWR
jgi:dihydroorotase